MGPGDPEASAGAEDGAGWGSAQTAPEGGKIGVILLFYYYLGRAVEVTLTVKWIFL